MKGQEIKHRLRSMERSLEPFEAKPPARTWIVSAAGANEEEAAAAVEDRIAKIKTGKVRHPQDGETFKESDKFLSVKVIKIEGRDVPDFDVEKALYTMAERRAADPGDNGGPPAVEMSEDEEIAELEERIAEVKKLLEDENGVD